MDFTINEMQKLLQEKYKDKWEPVGSETGKNKLLRMVGEIGEVIDIVKKNGGAKATTDYLVFKTAFTEMHNRYTAFLVERRSWYGGTDYAHGSCVQIN